MATRLDATSSGEQFAIRLQDALSELPAAETAGALWRVVKLTGGDPGVLLARLFARLSVEQKETVCGQLEDKLRLRT